VRFQAHEPAAAGEWPDAPLSVIAAPLSSQGVAALRRRLEAGAFALVLSRDAGLVATAASLAGESDWGILPTTRADALFGELDFRHPLFAAFADPRFSDFTHIRFWRPMPITLPPQSTATVVARFDDGGAAVIETPVGRGRLIVWGGDWTPDASQWVLSSKFVPWLQTLIERASGGPARMQSAEVGDAARLRVEAGATWRHITRGRAAAAVLASEPDAPGVYELDEPHGTRAVALQVPPAESRLEPIPLDTWEQLGVPLAGLGGPASAARPLDLASIATTPTALEREQQLWRWLLIAAVFVLACESALALATARRTPDPVA
jgi:hypothetical protein